MKALENPEQSLLLVAILRKQTKTCVQICEARESDVQMCVLGSDEWLALSICCFQNVPAQDSVKRSYNDSSCGLLETYS